MLETKEWAEWGVFVKDEGWRVWGEKGNGRGCEGMSKSESEYVSDGG